MNVKMITRWYFVFTLAVLLNIMLAIADEPLGGVPDDAELDEYGFLAEDYASSRVNVLTPEQLNTAILDGRITDFSFIENAKLQETMVQYPDLWKEEDLAKHVGTRIEKDVNFVNDAEQFKTAWFATYDVTCTDCKIKKFSAETGLVQTIDVTKLTGEVQPQEAETVVAFSLEQLHNVEILENGKLKMNDDSMIGNAALFVDEKNSVLEVRNAFGGLAEVILGDKDTQYVYQIKGTGNVVIAPDVSIIGKEILVSIEKGKHLVSSLSETPVEFRFIYGKEKYRRTIEKAAIPYAFKGVVTFTKEDLLITRTDNKVQGLRFAHISLGENTKLYDFNTGNVIAVTKPTEYYHSAESVFAPREEEYLQCKMGSNCIEYYLDYSQLGGVMNVHAVDNNQIKINVVNLETRENARYRSFQEKAQREIDLELARLFVDGISDSSTVSVNDNSRVLFTFSRDTPAIQGKITDRTIAVIETFLPPEEYLVDGELVAGVDPETIKETEPRFFRIDRNSAVGICADGECRDKGLFTSEKMGLTAAEISERVYSAAHRYALCSQVSEKCSADWGGLGFERAAHPQSKKVQSSKAQWVTTCIGLTKAALSPGIEEDLSAEIKEKIKQDKFADTGFFVQSYLRREVPGFKTTYIIVEENNDNFNDPREGEGTVLSLIQKQMLAGEDIEIIVVPKEEHRHDILASIPRGSFVTEPVNGHDYVYGGVDALSGRPTTYEAHVGGNRISRDIGGPEGVPILITYDKKSAAIDKNDILQLGGTILHYDGTEIKAEGGRAESVRQKINDLIKKDQDIVLEKVRRQREFEQLITQ